MRQSYSNRNNHHQNGGVQEYRNSYDLSSPPPPLPATAPPTRGAQRDPWPNDINSSYRHGTIYGNLAPAVRPVNISVL